MDLSEHTRFVMPQLERHLGRGLGSFGVPEPMTLDEWAQKHFYLSAESSYVEQQWTPWWFQRAIMAVISHDDIREVDLRKSARVGYTKIILAAVGYFAEHKRRNQALWQPTDDDRDEFVKTELEPMLRDVAVMRNVFPEYLARHKDNTLQAKKFLGSITHLKGGKAAKNYRRISIDTGYLDEYDAFDPNIEKEGDPGTLAAKRLEGATFGKLVIGTTPKLKGFSNIEKRERDADIFLTPHIPCPDCGEFHALTWGGKDEPHGFKWVDDNPETVRHLCPHCGALIDQAQYLALAAATSIVGRWQAEDGTTLDEHGVFRDSAGQIIRPPAHVALHVWSAYSPNVSWSGLVREFLSAKREAGEGKKEKLQSFVNTTLGEYWAEEYEKTDDNELRQRAEPFALERVPMNCLLLLAGIDTQPNRLEVSVWGYGRGCETWTIAHRIFFGNPDEDEVWADLEEYLFETDFPHASGQRLRIAGAAIDTGGHNTHAVYHWAAKHARRKVFAIKGRSGREKHIKDGASKVDIDWRGRLRKHGLVLWWVGTNHAKDLIHGRLQIQRPGPGYVHFSQELPDEWYKQFTGEARTTRRTARGEESTWTSTRKRIEAWDCAVYAVWLETYFELGRKSVKYWDDLEAKVQPPVADLFAQPIPQVGAGDTAIRPTRTPRTPENLLPPIPATDHGFGREDWSL
jgi:terminase, large subunit